MPAPRNDGYYPQDLNCGHWLKRLVRWALLCKHDWSITCTNGFGIPIEAKCIKCGTYRNRVLKSEDLPKLAEWGIGPRRKCASLNNKKTNRNFWNSH